MASAILLVVSSASHTGFLLFFTAFKLRGVEWAMGADTYCLPPREQFQEGIKDKRSYSDR